MSRSSFIRLINSNNNNNNLDEGLTNSNNNKVRDKNTTTI